MSKTKTIDLPSWPILKTLAELALPIMASSLLGTAYNITDMAWIGMLGSKAVAAVGVGGMYDWLSQGLVALPRMGGQGKCRFRSATYIFTGNLICCSMYRVYSSAARLFSPRRCRNLYRCEIIYTDYLRTDSVFIFKSDSDRTFYCAGSFQDTAYGKSSWTGW